MIATLYLIPDFGEWKYETGESQVLQVFFILKLLVDLTIEEEISYLLHLQRKIRRTFNFFAGCCIGY